MKLKQFSVAVPVTLIVLGGGVVYAGQTINDVGAIACVNDKWDVKEPEKGHKLVDYAGRCINVPDDAAAPKSTADCAGKYEYMPDGSWKGNGTCTYAYKGGAQRGTDSHKRVPLLRCSSLFPTKAQWWNRQERRSHR